MKFPVKGADHTRFADIDLTDTQIVGPSGSVMVFGSAFVADGSELAQKLGGDVNTCGLVSSSQATASASSAPSPAPSDPLLTGDRQRELLRTVAVSFFDAYLRGSSESKDLLQQLPDLVPELRVTSELK